MGIRTAIAAVLLLAFVGVLPDVAGAGGATDELRPAIDKVLRILDDPALKGEAKTRERRAALCGVMESAIDFPEAARRALAAHWRTRNSIIQTSSYEELVRRVRARVATLDEAPAAGIRTAPRVADARASSVSTRGRE